MNYRHIYHAGNFADVVKHYILSLIMQKMHEKEASFCAIDTHAGIGLYDLKAQEVEKTLEYQSGIQKLFDSPSVEASFEAYLKIIARYNHGHDQLVCYPGSPYILQAFLRKQDRLRLSELHPQDYDTLQQQFKHDPQVEVFHQSGYVSLKSLLPPPERRGVILIDPPFEKREEFDHLLKGIVDAYKRFATGIYLIWFPLKNSENVKKFYANLKALHIPKILCVEFYTNKNEASFKLSGSGLIMINPPWQIDQVLTSSLKTLMSYLSCTEKGEANVFWLADEF
ncbi:MAG: 23S rRNA (adenine(2030)-N(6))-methyltransferase RlmJ [Alphaproteobacteria bacterium]|nr:23S rRNA (adenine(2030)-N(6))-methyltransferase RlmJ [Alphaproteobacteria bacterium]